MWLARIRRPQGRKGEVFAELLTDFPEKFADRRRLWLLPEDPGAPGPSLLGTGEAKPDLPERVRSNSRTTGCTRAASCCTLRGWIPSPPPNPSPASSSPFPAPSELRFAEDEVYIADLIGCALLNVSKIDMAGAEPIPVGEIEDVDRTAGPVPLLIVRGPAGEILIPFAKSYLRKVDVAAKRVEMSLPEGLVDLNAATEN